MPVTPLSALILTLAVVILIAFVSWLIYLNHRVKIRRIEKLDTDTLTRERRQTLLYSGLVLLLLGPALFLGFRLTLDRFAGIFGWWHIISISITAIGLALLIGWALTANRIRA